MVAGIRVRDRARPPIAGEANQAGAEAAVLAPGFTATETDEAEGLISAKDLVGALAGVGIDRGGDFDVGDGRENFGDKAGASAAASESNFLAQAFGFVGGGGIERHLQR